MAKGPAVIGVLTEAPSPSWWRANRHRVLLVAGLLVGYWLGIHAADASPARPQPAPPTHTAPAHSLHALVQPTT